MGQRRWSAAALVLVLATVTACSALGPSVDCGELDKATCEQFWREAAAQMADTYNVPPDAQPVTVRVEATSMLGGTFCPSYISILWSNGQRTDVNNLC